MRLPMEWNVPPQSDGQFLPQQIRHAPHHFAGGLVRERQQQDAVGRDALLQQVGHAVGERARLARARAGDDQRRPGRRRHGRVLLLVEFARIIDLQMDRRPERLQHIVARHALNRSHRRVPMSNREWPAPSWR